MKMTLKHSTFEKDIVHVIDSFKFEVKPSVNRWGVQYPSEIRFYITLYSTKPLNDFYNIQRMGIVVDEIIIEDIEKEYPKFEFSHCIIPTFEYEFLKDTNIIRYSILFDALRHRCLYSEETVRIIEAEELIRNGNLYLGLKPKQNVMPIFRRVYYP